MQHKILFFALFFFMLIVSKAKANESEPNNTWDKANTLALNGTNNGDMNPAADVDWWKVTTNGDGAINLSLTSVDGRNIYFDLYDTLGVIALHTGTYTAGSTNYTVDGLAQGTYYIKIYCYYGTDTGRYTISNTLTVPTQANDAEPDSTRAQAIVLPLNGSKTGHIDYYYHNHRDSVDWYKVTTTADGRLRLRITSNNGQNVFCELFDNNAVTPLNTGTYTTSTTDVNTDGLAAGTYYIRIKTYYTTEFAPYTLSDSLFVPAQPNDPEPDSTRAQALTLNLNSSTTGHIDYYYNNHRDSVDWYKVTTNADGRLRLTMTSANGQNVYADLYDNNGTTYITGGYTSGSAVLVNQDGLAAGTYYIKVHTYYTTEFAPYTLADSLFVPTQPNDAEPDSTKATALTLPLDGSVTGHIGYYYNNHRDTVDEYKLTTTADGNINLSLSIPNGTPVWFSLYDNNGTTLLNQAYSSNNSNYNVDGLGKGTYYIKVFCYYNGQFAPYTLKDTLSTYNANDVEPNKYAKQAKTLNTNKAGNGHVGFYYNNVRDTTDWFKINYTGTNGSMSVTLNVIPNITGGAQNTWMQIYKDTAAAPLYNAYTTTSETANLTGLTEGYYYVHIFEYYNTFTAYTVTPTFTQVDKARIVTASYDTAASCTLNTITYKLSKSHSPYTVQLFRFGVKYSSAVTQTSTIIVFDSLPDGKYNATVFGDGATVNAFGKSDTITIMPAPPATSTTTIKSTQARLNWTVVSCADYDSIQYRVHGTTSWSSVTSANTGAFILKGLTPSTTYDWQVAAIDSSNKWEAISAFTPVTTFTTTATGFDIASTGDESDLSAGNSKLNNTLMISPNPASSYFTIHYNTIAKDRLIATLYDENAKPVWTSGTLNADALNGKQVIVSQFGSGLYYLKIINAQGGEVQSTKVSITR